MRRSLVTVLVLVLVVGGWILSGQFDLFKPDADGAVAAAASAVEAATTAAPSGGGNEMAGALTKVRARVLEARMRVGEIVARGRTEALRTVDVRAETYGRVVEVAAREGARVEAGDILVRLALDDRAARLAEAEALVRQRQLEFDASRKLAAKGYRARTSAAAAEAALDAAHAAVAQIETEIDHTSIRAPFDGVVEVRHVEIGDYLKVGEPIARVIDEHPFLVVANVSERDVGKLSLGMPATARLVTGQEVRGKVRYIATAADPATRTFRFEIEIPNPQRRLRAGVTSEIRVPYEEVRAHLVSPAILSLDDEGAIGVRIVNDDGVVEFHRAQIVADETAGVWLGGLPDTITLITVGQEFVRAGDRVEVILEDGGQAS